MNRMFKIEKKKKVWGKLCSATPPGRAEQEPEDEMLYARPHCFLQPLLQIHFSVFFAVHM